jgi:hypothetical protein
MTESPHAAGSSELMLAFAERTGLAPEGVPRRYLWTDAFAVCNLLGLARLTGEARYRGLAMRLIEQVHGVLGHHRADDARQGWLSGLPEQDGALHPTLGGLRIGKPLPERPRAARFDERLEWERDGQYFHYLTKWMHALDQASRATHEARFNAWARELAETAHRAFVAGPPGERRMAWKMSIDLSRPLVPGMGQHDPLDGLVTCLQLQATASALADAPREPSLTDAVSDFRTMVRGQRWTTADPLGIGGLLIDACRLAQLEEQGGAERGPLTGELLAAALEGLTEWPRRGELYRPAEERLAFRELGLAIGIGAVRRLAATAAAEGAWVDPTAGMRPGWSTGTSTT